MKLLNGGRHPGLSAARLVLCTIVVAVVMLGRPAEARAVGMASHKDVVDTASGPAYSQRYPDLATLLRKYPGAVASGSVFPDWGYSIDVIPWHEKPYAKDSEVPHEHEDCDPDTDPPAILSYRDAFVNYLQSTLSPPYSEDDLKTIAFLYGLISHVEADHMFDRDFMPAAQRNDATDFLDIHDEPDHYQVDATVDVEIVAQKGWTEPEWFFPREAIAAAYEAVGCKHVTVDKMNWALDDEFIPKIGTAIDGEWLFAIGANKRWTRDNYQSAPGGMDDLYEATATAWQQMWETWKPVTTIGLSPAAPAGDKGAYRQPVTIQFEATAFLNGQIETWYSLDSNAYQLYTGPFTVSSEGIHDIAYYSVDLLKNAEDAPIFSIKGDAKSETVEIDRVDEPCPAGPQPSGECNLQPPPYYVVVNGQQPSLNRDGSGCSPFILRHPECTDCATCNVDVESELCEPYLTGVVPEGQTEVVYEMCRAGDAWRFRVRTLDSMGNCPIDEANPDWLYGLPPGTGIKLPAPVIVGGLAILGAGFMAAGVVLRRRKS